MNVVDVSNEALDQITFLCRRSISPQPSSLHSKVSKSVPVASSQLLALVLMLLLKSLALSKMPLMSWKTLSAERDASIRLE